MKKVAFVIIAGVVMIASCSKKTASTTDAKTPEPVSAAAPALYEKNCAKCHGATGVEGKAPKIAGRGNKERIANIIARGKGHMPAFSDKLSVNEMVEIAVFVLSLKKP